jgi:GMP synthase (glutamine-hydrolysing)
LLATGDDVPLQAFRYGAVAWGLQFHLEVDRAEIERWLEAQARASFSPGETTRQILDETDRFIDAHEDRARELFRRFWAIVRARSDDRG